MQTARVASAAGTVAGVQYLRGIAATMVAYFHLVGQIPSLAPYIEKDLLGYTSLASGVDVFFVISGFIMLLTTQRSSPAEFAVRRVIRVAPLYWLLTLVVVGIALWSPQVLRTTQVDLKSTVLSMLFIPYQNPGHQGEMVPILVPGWSLNFEMFFYAIFALVLFWPSLRGRVLINGLVFLALIVLHLSPLATAHPVFAFLTQWRIAEFWLGMLIGLAYVKRAFIGQSPWFWCAILIASFAVLIVHPAPRNPEVEILLFTLLPAGFIVVSTVALEQLGRVPKIPFLLKLGDASYSIYLSHILVLGVCRGLWQHFGLPAHSLTAAAFFVTFSTAAVIYGGMLLYRAVERPMTDFLHRLHRKRLVAVPAMTG